MSEKVMSDSLVCRFALATIEAGDLCLVYVE